MTIKIEFNQYVHVIYSVLEFKMFQLDSKQGSQKCIELFTKLIFFYYEMRLLHYKFNYRKQSIDKGTFHTKMSEMIWWHCLNVLQTTINKTNTTKCLRRLNKIWHWDLVNIKKGKQLVNKHCVQTIHFVLVHVLVVFPIICSLSCSAVFEVF